MSKPAVELAEVVRRFGSLFLEAYGTSLSLVQKTVLRALVQCRTSALGGHLEQCDHPDCSYQRPAYNSCLPVLAARRQAATAIAPNASPWPKPAGSLPASSNCCRWSTFTWS